MTDDPPAHDSFGTLRSPFLFVPDGDPEPLEWMAAHPGWVKFPAVMVPRRSDARVRYQREEPMPGGDPEARLRQVPDPGRRASPQGSGPPDPYDPASPAFDAVLTLRRIGDPAAGTRPVIEAQWLELGLPPLDPLLESPLSKPPEGILPRLMERVPGQPGKEAADDTPSWSRGIQRRVGETPESYARRVMDERWGRGKWEGRPDRDREFKRIKKFGSRAFRNPKIYPTLLMPSEGDTI